MPRVSPCKLRIAATGVPDPGAKAVELVFAALCPWAATAFHHRERSRFIMNSAMHHLKNNQNQHWKGFDTEHVQTYGFSATVVKFTKRDCEVPRVGPDIPQGKTGFCSDQVVRFESKMRVRAFQRTTSTELWHVTPTWYVLDMGHFLETHEPEIGQSWSFKGLTLLIWNPSDETLRFHGFDVCILNHWSWGPSAHWQSEHAITIIIESLYSVLRRQGPWNPHQLWPNLLISTNTCACRKVRENQSGKGGKCRWTT